MKPKTIVFTAILVAVLSGYLTHLIQTHRNAQSKSQQNEYGISTPIARKHNQTVFTLDSPKPQPLPTYPWNQNLVGNLPKITKEHFRCKGSSLNPVHTFSQKGQMTPYYDCGGSSKHSLPLREGKEYIYPVLIELTNYIQNKTGKRLVITSGHRCPEHNAYVDPAIGNQYSKHMIGAEVSFYVQGLEEKPEMIVPIIQEYYKQQPGFVFQRYEKDDTNVSTPPWFNKEIFVKVFKKTEGRNFDNRHPYPYISIQVRWDRDTNEKVTYSWDKAFRNFHRY